MKFFIKKNIYSQCAHSCFPAKRNNQRTYKSCCVLTMRWITTVFKTVLFSSNYRQLGFQQLSQVQFGLKLFFSTKQKNSLMRTFLFALIVDQIPYCFVTTSISWCTMHNLRLCKALIIIIMIVNSFHREAKIMNDL